MTDELLKFRFTLDTLQRVIIHSLSVLHLRVLFKNEVIEVPARVGQAITKELAINQALGHFFDQVTSEAYHGTSCHFLVPVD